MLLSFPFADPKTSQHTAEIQLLKTRVKAKKHVVTTASK